MPKSHELAHLSMVECLAMVIDWVLKTRKIKLGALL